MRRSIHWPALALLLCAAAASGDDAATPGELIVDNPTLRNLAFRWPIIGDADRDATVEVRYRRKGQAEWRPALPMLRTVSPGGTHELFAGSVLNLEPGTTYEVRFEMRDPDGLKGASERTVEVATRAEPPEIVRGRRHLYAYPDGGDDLGLQAACDAARAGDVVLLHAGRYTGSYVVKVSGTKAEPIVFRPAGDGEAVLDGSARREPAFVVQPHCDYIHFERLSFHGGRAIRGNDCAGLVVRRCRFTEVTSAVGCGGFNSQDWYIADNVIVGPYKQWRKRTNEPGGTGITISGRGHVVCHNRVSWFWDCINTASYWKPYRVFDLDAAAIDAAGPQMANDVYNNAISHAVDDAIQADYLLCNNRLQRNRITSSLVGVSVQPSYIGPIYITRNVISDMSQCPWKLHVGVTDVLLYHNTTAGFYKAMYQSPPTLRNSAARNNIFFGRTQGAEWSSAAAGRFATDVDYNAYNHPEKGATIRWTTDGGETWQELAGPGAFAEAAGHEAHGIVTDWASCFAGEARYGYDIDREPDGADMHLISSSPAVDAGQLLPTINDDFKGKAPDLGAYELGEPAPCYGPRPEEGDAGP